MSKIAVITQAVVVLAEFGNVTGLVAEDGKVNLADLSALPRLLSVQPEFFSLVTNATELKEEFKSLTPEQIVELEEVFAARFDIPNDKVEETIEKAAALLDEAYGLFNSIKSFASVFKK